VIHINVLSQAFNRCAAIANKVREKGNEHNEEENKDDETDNVGAFSLLNRPNLDLGYDLSIKTVGVLDTHLLVELVADHFLNIGCDYKICTQFTI
jgi:hypothetical protein